MKKNKILMLIIFIFLILFFGLLCLLLFLLNNAEDFVLQNKIENIEISYETNPKTIEQVFKNYDSEYIGKENNKIYANFSKDLFNQNGGSNENFFKNIIKDLIPIVKLNIFYLIDDEKDIEIYIEVDENNNFKILVNNIENFFEKIDGKSYVEVEISEIVKGSNMSIKDQYLEKLQIYNSYFSHIKDELGEGTELGNGYSSYLNRTLKIRTVPTGTARNIIFLKGYEGQITNNISSGMKLNEIYELEPNNDFGSLNSGYLGYRQTNYYIFCYNDEISVYSYSYNANTTFEKILRDYLKTKDLKKFVNDLSSHWMAYDYLEYDEEKNEAHILYSTRGLDINIENNDSMGIKFYSNYYFTDYTKFLVKNGIVSFEANTDLVEKIEIERRNNN